MHCLDGVEYISQTLIDASFRKACRLKLIYVQYSCNVLSFDVESKLFACSKSDLHCLHHMLSMRSCI